MNNKLKRSNNIKLYSKKIFKKQANNLSSIQDRFIQDKFIQDCILKSIPSLRRMLITKAINSKQASDLNQIKDILQSEIINYITTPKFLLNLNKKFNIPTEQIDSIKDNMDFCLRIINNSFLNVYINKYLIIIKSYEDLVRLGNDEKFQQYIFNFLGLIAKIYINNILTDTSNLNIDKKFAKNQIKKSENNITAFLQQQLKLAFKYKNFYIDDINNFKFQSSHYILCKLNENDIDRFILFLLKSPILNISSLFKQEIDSTDLDSIVEDINTIKNIDNILNSNIAIGSSVPIDGELLHCLSHSISYLPIIYINGNIVSSNDMKVKQFGSGRLHHDTLFDTYFKNISLHVNDRVKHTEEEWKEKDGYDWNTVTKYHGIRATKDKNNVIIIYNNQSYVNEAIDKLRIYFPGCKIFVMNTNATLLTKEAKRKQILFYRKF